MLDMDWNKSHGKVRRFVVLLVFCARPKSEKCQNGPFLWDAYCCFSSGIWQCSCEHNLAIQRMYPLSRSTPFRCSLFCAQSEEVIGQIFVFDSTLLVRRIVDLQYAVFVDILVRAMLGIMILKRLYAAQQQSLTT
jgi:hypothetical protein